MMRHKLDHFRGECKFTLLFFVQNELHHCKNLVSRKIPERSIVSEQAINANSVHKIQYVGSSYITNNIRGLLNLSKTFNIFVLL
jgi:hypothetical protein